MILTGALMYEQVKSSTVLTKDFSDFYTVPITGTKGKEIKEKLEVRIVNLPSHSQPL